MNGGTRRKARESLRRVRPVGHRYGLGARRAGESRSCVVSPIISVDPASTASRSIR